MVSKSASLQRRRNSVQYIKLGVWKTGPMLWLQTPMAFAWPSCHPASCSIQVWGSNWGSIRSACKALHHRVGMRIPSRSRRTGPVLCSMSWGRHIGMHSIHSTSKVRQSCSKGRTQGKGRFSVLHIQCGALQAHNRRSSSSKHGAQSPWTRQWSQSPS